MNLDRKKLFWAFSFIAVLCALFWLFSRYPALDSMAIMEGEMNFEGIGFDQVIDVPVNASTLEVILINTVNWLETNRHGMTFGILFSAAIMLLFSLLQNIQSKYTFVNSIVGVFIGFPLGVCVNSAAPIAKGVYSGGGRAATALSMMVSSPTLNVVVLTMSFSIFPLYMAGLKVLLSLLIAVFVVPILVRFFAPKVEASTFKTTDSLLTQQHNLFNPSPDELLPSKNIIDALKWFVGSYAKRLWYIIKLTVPLMVLAGFLGNILIHILPWDLLSGIGLHGTLGKNLTIMLAIAVVGVLLPVPMAFDVIVVTVLMASGLPPLFAMVLLLTLGSFSVYSFFIVWQTFNWRLATSIALTIVLMSAGAGLIAHKNSSAQIKKQSEFILTTLSGENPCPTGHLLFPEKKKEKNCIVFKLSDEMDNQQPIGSKIVINCAKGTKRQLQELRLSGGCRSFNPVEAHFGLGEYDLVDLIAIHWSTGEMQMITGPFPAGYRYTVKRNELKEVTNTAS